MPHLGYDPGVDLLLLDGLIHAVVEFVKWGGISCERRRRKLPGVPRYSHDGGSGQTKVSLESNVSIILTNCVFLVRTQTAVSQVNIETQYTRMNSEIGFLGAPCVFLLEFLLYFVRSSSLNVRG